MDMPKLKDVLSLLKDYSSLVVPAVLIAVAIIILLVTPMLMGSRLEDKVKKGSISLGQQADRLGSDVVPQEQWKLAQEYQKAHEADANEIAELAMQTTQRELLSYELFPEPKDKSIGVYSEFGKRYRQAIEGLIENLNATQCPTEIEISSVIGNSGVSTGNYPSGLSASAAAGGGDSMIRDVICTERARFGALYAQPDDVAGYWYWDSEVIDKRGARFEYSNEKEAVETCWFWQLGYWINEDIMATISALNAGSKTVYNSPVKRLIQVAFINEAVKTDRNKPEYFAGGPNGVLTSRATDDSIDVVHFVLSVVVTNKALLPFMQELSAGKVHKFRGFSGNEPERTLHHNQISILDSKAFTIQRDSKEHNSYRYGDEAVVQLDLVCEYIFNKAGYDPAKPASLKAAAAESAPEY
jgi:hypothetical protein